jgi:hypothetical protein
MDNGFPLSTEGNVLKELVQPPSGIKNAMKAIGVGKKSKYVHAYDPRGSSSVILIGPSCWPMLMLSRDALDVSSQNHDNYHSLCVI